MPTLDVPLYTLEMPASQFTVPAHSTFIYARSASEDRAVPSPSWFTNVDEDQVRLITVSQLEEDAIEIVAGTDTQSISLHDSGALSTFLDAQPQPVYIDITGLSHSVWAPLVRATHGSSADVRVVYIEPEEYMRWRFRDSERIYDLSSKFDGMRAIPGFARIEPADVTEVESLFVPMLGFEGSRLEYVLDQTEANVEATYPIVGVPGFRPDYAFYSLQGNRRALERDFMHRRVRLAKANCPFEAFRLLESIHDSHQSARLRIAPIGTKPHALGAILYALAKPRQVEIVYDNPVRRRGRSAGQARVLVYGLSAFMRNPEFGWGT